MNWKLVSLGPLFMWAVYSVFASLSTKANGEKVTMAIEACAMTFVAVLVFSTGGSSDFRKVTLLSLTYAIVMAFMSAIGLLVQFYAFRIAPQNAQGTVVMITCMFPVLAFAVFDGMYRLGIPGGAPGSLRQWLGVACGAVALWLISGGEKALQ